MHDLLVKIELVPLLLLAVLLWTAAGRAAALPHSGSVERLQRKCLAMTGRTVYLSLLAAATAVIMVSLTLYAEPADGWNRLLLQIPLTILPAVLLWIVAYPRLEHLRKEAALHSGAAARAALAGPASRAGLVTPYYIASFGALAALYVTLIPSGAFRPGTAAVPAVLFTAASIAAWRHQASRAFAIRMGAALPARKRPRRAGSAVSHLGVAHQLDGLEVRR